MMNCHDGFYHRYMRRNWDWKLACDITALYAFYIICNSMVLPGAQNMVVPLKNYTSWAKFALWSFWCGEFLSVSSNSICRGPVYQAFSKSVTLRGLWGKSILTTVANSSASCSGVVVLTLLMRKTTVLFSCAAHNWLGEDQSKDCSGGREGTRENRKLKQ